MATSMFPAKRGFSRSLVSGIIRRSLSVAIPSVVLNDETILLGHGKLQDHGPLEKYQSPLHGGHLVLLSTATLFLSETSESSAYNLTALQNHHFSFHSFGSRSFWGQVSISGLERPRMAQTPRVGCFSAVTMRWPPYAQGWICWTARQDGSRSW